ncbi:MAG: L,D-transpeptidase family protein [Ignavibacteria bacterium]|nr:L,D-transpeptidase family protein [Ignavibacteria bacterium]
MRFFILSLFLISYNSVVLSQNAESQSGKIKSEIKGFEKLTVETNDQEQADISLREHITEFFPIIPEREIESILTTRESKPLMKINPETGDTTYTQEWSFNVKENFLADTTKILWELNIPQFQSNIYQLYKDDTLYIDTWNHVVGTIKTKTLTGNFEAFRVRNWPSWKDPDPKKAHLEATPPGPKNPLGLFTVWYDPNSLRYFHGTNKPHLLDNEDRDLSHGCVRTGNDNIDKMKRFLIKRVIKSRDLSGWIKSKKSMQFDFAEEDKFPVRIIYKTFDINSDENGNYIELYDDIYKYSNPKNINPKNNDVSLITLTTVENIKEEFKREFNKGLNEEQLDFLADWLVNNGKVYERYYFSELKEKFLMQ